MIAVVYGHSDSGDEVLPRSFQSGDSDPEHIRAMKWKVQIGASF